MIKPLDIVETPQGGIAVVTELNPQGDNFNHNRYSITFLAGKNPRGEHNAWWNEEHLKYIDSIPALIAGAMAHPFGSNKNANRKCYE